MTLELLARGRRFDLDVRALVMGILNRTPDSFYDKGSYFDFDDFLFKADSLISHGADILDVGGVKAGPGPEVSLDEELNRVVPAIEALRARFDCLISVDTWNAKVFAASVGVGAEIGNDISGFRDPDYLAVASSSGAAVVATHIRLKPREKDPDPRYNNLVVEVESFLLERARRATEVGIEPGSIILDAGFDLGKTTEQSLALLGSTASLTRHGLVVLISASNKGFIGEALALDISQRRSASLAAVASSYIDGARVFRVHDVRGTRRVLDTLGAIVDPDWYQTWSARVKASEP